MYNVTKFLKVLWSIGLHLKGILPLIFHIDILYKIHAYRYLKQDVDDGIYKIDTPI